MCFIVCFNFFGEYIVATVQVPNIDQFLQVPTFAGWTSLTLSRFIFSSAYTYLDIVPGL